jgi:hypothetical protein
MIFSDPSSLVIDLRLGAGWLIMAFSIISVLRLASQYRQFHYSQSVYSIILMSSLFGDALLRTVALSIFVQPDGVVTPSMLLGLGSQWLLAIGVMFFTFYLIGILNGFWSKLPPVGEITLPGHH